MYRRVLIFGDDIGIPEILDGIHPSLVCGLVAAGIRPMQHHKIACIARKGNLPLIIQPKVASPEYLHFVETITTLKPDLVIVNSYSMLLRREILSIPQRTVNIHPALLPEYRGANPLQWALINDEVETGVTMHVMEETIDSGPIIAQRRVPILFDDTWPVLMVRLRGELKILLNETVPSLLAGTASWYPQDESRAKTWRRRHPEDGLIDFSRDVRYIYNSIRALVEPHPGAFYLSSSSHRCVIDKYLTLNEVVGLKYGVGEQVIRAGDLEIKPSSSTGIVNKSNTTIEFDVFYSAENAGKAKLFDIDNVTRQSKLEITLSDTRREHGLQARDLLLQFAFDDLKLKKIIMVTSGINDLEYRCNGK